jgi:hypothetical protein
MAGPLPPIEIKIIFPKFDLYPSKTHKYAGLQY